MKWRKSVLEVRTFQSRMLDAVLLGLVLLVVYLAVGLLSRNSKDQASPTILPSVSKIPRVAVLNGCGVSEVALQFAEFLQTHEVDVVEVGNHNSFNVEESVVVDRIGDLSPAIHVAAVLGIPESNVIQQLKQENNVDVLIVIGHDFDRLRPFRSQRKDLSSQ